MNTVASPPEVAAAFGWRQGWRYGLMGLPLAFVALPLYVQLPNYYAKTFGMPLATLGAVLHKEQNQGGGHRTGNTINDENSQQRAELRAEKR